jgi:phosphate transport system substrate-binding protein
VDGGAGNRERPGAGSAWGAIVDQILKRRLFIYAIFLAGIVAWRLWPTVTPAIRKVPGIGENADGERIVISGTDNAPALLMQAVVQFQSDYPKVNVQLEGGGTVHALEDLLNKRAAIGALSRPPTAEEQQIAVARKDSLVSLAVALGGIAVLVPRSSGIESMTLEEVRSLIAGAPAASLQERGITRLYGPDPNSGLWEALLTRLGYEQVFQPRYIPLATGQLVIEALRQDANAIGFASDLTYELPADDPGVRVVPISAQGADAVAPTKANIVEGTYPLYHNLYLCTTVRGDVVANGFVTYYTQPTGQRWVAKRGFLPARLPAREIRLTGAAAS